MCDSVRVEGDNQVHDNCGYQDDVYTMGAVDLEVNVGGTPFLKSNHIQHYNEHVVHGITQIVHPDDFTKVVSHMKLKKHMNKRHEEHYKD